MRHPAASMILLCCVFSAQVSAEPAPTSPRIKHATLRVRTDVGEMTTHEALKHCGKPAADEVRKIVAKAPVIEIEDDVATLVIGDWRKAASRNIPGEPFYAFWDEGNNSFVVWLALGSNPSWRAVKISVIRRRNKGACYEQWYGRAEAVQ